MLAVIFLNRMISRRRNTCKMAYEVKKESNTADLEHCRTCLCTDDLVELFSNKESERKRSKDLCTITGLKIKINDGLSQKICTKCIKSLEAAMKFRRISRKTYKSLLNVAPGVKSKPKYSTKVPEPEEAVQKTLETKIEEFRDEDFSCDAFGDDFQNDQTDPIDPIDQNDPINPIDQNDHYEHNNQDFKVDVEIKPKKIKQKPVKPPVEKKPRMDIPNASSYKCSWCSKEFRMKATFKAHMRFHTNYCVCEACGKRCRNNNQLQEHKRARHGLGKIHKCAYCEYSSATKEALTIHERRHTGERPYICDHCGATFHRRSNLVQHIAIHLPEKNFQCSECLIWEKSHRRLMIHKSKRHSTKRYRYLCPVCKCNFPRPYNVRRHLVRVHGVARTEQGVIEKIFAISSASENMIEMTGVKTAY